MSMKRFWKWQYIVPAALVAAPVIIALFVFLGGGIVMLLWNWLLPPLFGWPQISLLQGFGLLMLCRILFGGFGGGGGNRSGGCHPKKRRKTPEEEEQFRQRMRERFGDPSAGTQES